MFNEPEPPNELLACFDDLGNKIEPHTRKEIHQVPIKYWHAVVNVWLVDDSGRMVCSLRSKKLTGNPDKWQTYFGGHVKADSTFKEAAGAELKEEVGLKIEVDKLFLIETGKNELSKHFFESYAYPFVGSLKKLHFNDGEIVKASWFSFDEYNSDRQKSPEKWCNGCSPENQKLITKWLNERYA